MNSVFCSMNIIRKISLLDRQQVENLLGSTINDPLSVVGNQENPFSGDVVNSYNDRPLQVGTIIGPFYEIESTSPAAFLAPGESIKQIQRVLHISGNEDSLNKITIRLFGLNLEKIKTVFSAE
ncbi:MAG: DUF6786 family protein [Bacteroidales bacterium]